jgi:hypothetical protein
MGAGSWGLFAIRRIHARVPTGTPRGSTAVDRLGAGTQTTGTVPVEPSPAP